MATKMRCPYCGCADVKTTLSSYVKQGAAIAAVQGAKILLKQFTGISAHGSTIGTAKEFTKTTKRCNNCHREWEVKE